VGLARALLSSPHLRQNPSHSLSGLTHLNEHVERHNTRNCCDNSENRDSKRYSDSWSFGQHDRRTLLGFQFGLLDAWARQNHTSGSMFSSPCMQGYDFDISRVNKDKYVIHGVAMKVMCSSCVPHVQLPAEGQRL
jgi:hypothetical protein